jgi:hypothetical protein
MIRLASDRLMPAPARHGLLATALLLSACAAPGASAPETSSIAEPTPSAAALSTPSAAAVSTPESSPDPSIVVLSAFANIFGAGHESAPAPGGGGGGELPPVWPLAPGETRIVTFPSATGRVYGRIGQAPFNEAGGEELLGTDVESFGGISGIVHGTKAMFLVGVFLTDDPPANPAPARLDFTDNEDFDLLEPEIGQTFLIGDGIGRRYLVPAGGTRLFLGFAEGMFYKGSPGWYGNNFGELEVKIDLAVE